MICVALSTAGNMRKAWIVLIPRAVVAKDGRSEAEPANQRWLKLRLEIEFWGNGQHGLLIAAHRKVPSRIWTVIRMTRQQAIPEPEI